MSKRIFSCGKDCVDRSATCHATCEKYKQECEANEQRKKELKLNREITNYTNNSIVERLNKQAIAKKRAGWYGRAMEI